MSLVDDGFLTVVENFFDEGSRRKEIPPDKVSPELALFSPRLSQHVSLLFLC